MASPLDLKGRAVISDGATSVLRKIKGSLDDVANSTKRLTVAGNALQSFGRTAQRAGAQLSGGVVAGGFALRSLIDQTRGFNEAKFGYGFARITDYIKDGKLDTKGWRAEMNRVAGEAQVAAKAFGTLPEITMKAREETEKLGFKGAESKAIFNAAMGLHLAEPGSLSSGESAKYLGAVYRGYEKQRLAEAKATGQDPNSPEFIDRYTKGLAAKAAVAGADSALGPADIVEGMRQYAPQWAAMGIDYDFALAALAHGSNYGFRAPELGTAYKSLVNKVINPSAGGLAVLNNLGIDRSKFFKSGAQEPAKAATSLNSLLSGQLYAGKGGQKFKSDVIRPMLDKAYKDGSLNTPAFQEKLTGVVMKRLGPGYAARYDDVHAAVSNSTLSPQGDIDLPGYLKALRDAGATVGQIASIFEGRHISRNMPMFQFYEKLLGTRDKLKGVDGTVVDAVVEGRKESEAGKTDAMFGSWQSFMINLEQSGGIVDVVKTQFTALNEALGALPVSALNALVGAVVAIGGVLVGTAVVGAARGVGGVLAGAAGGVAGGVVGAHTGKGYKSPIGPVKPGLGVGKVAARFIPGIGLVVMGASAAHDAYEGYQKDGLRGGAMGAADGMTFGGASWLSGYDGGKPGTPGAASVGGGGPGTPGAASVGGGGPGSDIENQARATVARIRQVMAIDLTAEGRRAMETFANGIREAGETAVSAAESVASRVRAAGSRVQLNTGPNMQPAR